MLVAPLLLIGNGAGLVRARVRTAPPLTAGWERLQMDAGGGYSLDLPPDWHGATVTHACSTFYCARLVISNATVHADALLSNATLPPGSVAIAVGAGVNVYGGRGAPTCARGTGGAGRALVVDGVHGEEYRGSLSSDFAAMDRVMRVCLPDPLAPPNYYGLAASIRDPDVERQRGLIERMLATIRFNRPTLRPWWRRGRDWLGELGRR